MKSFHFQALWGFFCLSICIKWTTCVDVFHMCVTALCKCPCLLHMCLWRLEVDTRCLPQVPSTLFIFFFLRKGLLLNTELCHLNSVGRFPCLFLSSAGLAGGLLSFGMDSGVPNAVHHACTVSVLSTVPSPQPALAFLDISSAF